MAGVFYEIRREQAAPGHGAELAQWMDERVIPLHEAAGMTVVGAFTDADNGDMFVWIRKFRSPEEKEEIVDRVHRAPVFDAEIVPRMKQLLAGEAVTVRLVPTAHSRLD